MFDALLEEEIARAARYRRPVSLLMLDIDRFNPAKQGGRNRVCRAESR